MSGILSDNTKYYCSRVVISQRELRLHGCLFGEHVLTFHTWGRTPLPILMRILRANRPPCRLTAINYVIVRFARVATFTGLSNVKRPMVLCVITVTSRVYGHVRCFEEPLCDPESNPANRHACGFSISRASLQLAVASIRKKTASRRRSPGEIVIVSSASWI